MKKVTVLILFMAFWVIPEIQGQSIDDFISGQRGDTLVVKDYVAMGFAANSLADLVELDTSAPDSRVYELVSGGLYFHTRTIQVTDGRPLDITGEDDTPFVVNSSGTKPPIIVGTQIGDADLRGSFIYYTSNTTIKNIIGGAHSASDLQGWTYFDAGASEVTLTLDNVYMEHTNWVFVQNNQWPDNSLKIANSYFVNMSGNGCRRNGGIYDNVSNPTDSIWVENSTIVMGAGRSFIFRGWPINNAVFNHNTFVNISNAVFSTMGYQVDWTVTNNLFVNTNVQAYYPGLDIFETDQDFLPSGIINVDSLVANNNSVPQSNLPQNFQDADPSQWEGMRRILVDKNAVFWSPELSNIVQMTEEIHSEFLDTLNGGTNLMTSMMTMNSRTQAMFNNNETWPYLTEGEWIQAGDPEFVNDFGLLDENDALGEFIDYTTQSLPDGNPINLESLRTTENPATGADFAISDWPIPVDLSYSNVTYLNGGLNGFPVGDINWFPEKKAEWLAQRSAEYATIESAKNNGNTLPGSISGSIVTVSFPDNLHGMEGDTLVVPVLINSPGVPQIESFEFELAFDPNLLEISSVLQENTLSEGAYLEQNQPEPGILVVAMAGLSPIDESGTILNIELVLNVIGAPTLTWNNFMFNEGAPEVYTQNGSISVLNYLCGDVTGDSSISSLDASWVLRHTVHLLPQYPLVDTDSLAADVTGNGRISAFDASKILQFEAGMINELACAPAAGKQARPIIARAGWELHEQGDDLTVAEINFEGTEFDVFAAQLILSVDEAASYKGVTGLPKGWNVVTNTAEGKLYVSMYGVTPLEDKALSVEFVRDEGTSGGRLSGQLILNESEAVNLNELILAELPTEFSLEQNYPNPFNPTTNIRYALPEAAEVELTIFNTLGQEVARLVNTRQEAGAYTVTWDARAVSSGVYIYRLTTGGKTFTKRMMLIK